jgi:hypothetical protein
VNDEHRGPKPGVAPIDQRFALAGARYERLLRFYERQMKLDRIKYQVLQGVAVIFGGLTPILVLANTWPKWLQAAPSAVASICVGLIGFAQWRENWIRFAATAEALKHERSLLDTRTGAYGPGLEDQLVLETFVQAIENLSLAETEGWKQLADGGTGPSAPA